MADCVTRVWALAVATAACIGLPSALVYAIVRIAAARRYGAVFAMAVVLVFWVTISAAYYPRVCADLVPWPRFLRLPQRPSSSQVDGDRAGSGALPREAAEAEAPAARGVRADDGVLLPLSLSLSPSPYPYEHQRVPLAQRQGDRPGGSRLMAALHREPPGKARADDVPRPPCDGGPSKYCAICLADVDKEETAKRLPLCLHVFHRHCIDQWLQGHSTCPICSGSVAVGAESIVNTSERWACIVGLERWR
ncbi:hypothetical protein BDA96_04G106100 [Sorghum bicolor]|uniref:RING-type E3 ubiquitin transferase n=1 Tax=Sorghum bicolor TaxID=4558 RepID=A0A921R217_SORBI|nr:hypothetical protein BDA96_04G106100 [Sorghum bicolor]